MKDKLTFMKVIVDFLSQLSDEQLNDLLTKKAKLKVEYPKQVEATPVDINQITNICNKLDLCNTREEAYLYFNNLNILKSDLRNIAKHYNIPLASKDTNTQLIEKIIENVIGSKLRFDALLNTKLKN